MKVLWFTNVPLPQVAAAAGRGTSGFGGHWMTELFNRVVARPGVRLGVATAFPGLPDLQFEQDSVSYYAISQSRRARTFGGSRAELGKCAAAVRHFGPDLIHFHGSERFFGLLKADALVSAPAVVSLQGLLGPYSEYRNFFGALSPWDVARSTRLVELPLGIGLLWQYADIRRGARQEARLIAAVEGLLGRTDWDEEYARRLNPRASYHRVGEILRTPFHEARWSLAACERHALVYTNAGHPRRGTENLLAAVAMLREEFPAIRLRLAGAVSERSGYGRFLRGRIRALGLQASVEFAGYLDADAMARELVRAHAFVISSYIENSPNSLAEAMMVGMPCIASAVGGVPSMVENGRTGFLYPVEDIPTLAGTIRRVFRDDEGAVRAGAAARHVAELRHDPATVTDQLMAAYSSVLDAARNGKPT